MSGLKDMDSSLASKESNNNEESIPILLLSKDLINHINSINENDIEIKNGKQNNKVININYFNSRESSNGEDPSLKSSEFKKINYQINQKDIENNNFFSSKFFQPSMMNSFNTNFPHVINISNEKNIKNEIKKNHNELNPIINNIDNNLLNNNYFQNNMNILKSCFTMNGKTGWICSNCKNFNYESK